VDFHGEMLLLVHWSILSYTGLVKIMKKHHKRTGLLICAPLLEDLLSQPFCSVEVGQLQAQWAICLSVRTQLSQKRLNPSCSPPGAVTVRAATCFGDGSRMVACKAQVARSITEKKDSMYGFQTGTENRDFGQLCVVLFSVMQGRWKGRSSAASHSSWMFFIFPVVCCRRSSRTWSGKQSAPSRP
jgi:hypothetical protein